MDVLFSIFGLFDFRFLIFCLFGVLIFWVLDFFMLLFLDFVYVVFDFFFSFLGLTRYHSLIPSLMHSLIPFMIQSHGKVGPENGSGGTLGWVWRPFLTAKIGRTGTPLKRVPVRGHFGGPEPLKTPPRPSKTAPRRPKTDPPAPKVKKS